MIWLVCCITQLRQLSRNGERTGAIIFACLRSAERKGRNQDNNKKEFKDIMIETGVFDFSVGIMPEHGTWAHGDIKAVARAVRENKYNITRLIALCKYSVQQLPSKCFALR